MSRFEMAFQQGARRGPPYTKSSTPMPESEFNNPEANADRFEQRVLYSTLWFERAIFGVPILMPIMIGHYFSFGRKVKKEGYKTFFKSIFCIH